MAPRDALVKSGLLMSQRNVKDDPAVSGAFTPCDIKHDSKDAMFITGSSISTMKKDNHNSLLSHITTLHETIV